VVVKTPPPSVKRGDAGKVEEEEEEEEEEESPWGLYDYCKSTTIAKSTTLEYLLP